MKRLWNAFLYSLSGLKLAWKEESAFREEVLIAAVAIPAAFYLAPDNISLLLMVGSILLVLLVELLNSAIEAAIDRSGMEKDAFGKKAKDTASAAVLIALLNVVLVWGVILLR